MKLYHLKSCDTCKKAIKALAEFDPELIEIRATPPTRADIETFLDAVGAEALVNRRSTTWRNLSEAERAGAPVELLLAHPTLMKRPVIVTDAGVTVGWSKAVETALKR